MPTGYLWPCDAGRGSLMVDVMPDRMEVRPMSVTPDELRETEADVEREIERLAHRSHGREVGR
jgi:hypothetical protein